jgi:hypothetical protein
MQFKKAERKKAKLRLELTGPSGSGKTLGALMIAKGIGGKIAFIDTEHESASLYAEPVRLANGAMFTPPDFDTLSLSAPFAPERFVEAIRSAEDAGYDIIILDSATHEWSGVGGCLEINDNLAASKYRGNSFTAWNETTPRHRAFVDAILRSRCHVIVTARSKTEMAQTEDRDGKKKVIKLGMKAEQRDGLEYEFTTVLDIIHAGNYATASKDRTGIFSGDPAPITEETGRKLAAWLENGIDPMAAFEADVKKVKAFVDPADLRSWYMDNQSAFESQYGSAQMATLFGAVKMRLAELAPPPKEEEKVDA